MAAIGSLNNLKDTLAAKRTALKALKAEVAELATKVKTYTADNKAIKAAARADRKAARIAALEAKLLNLKIGPVGVAAKRAARKAGPVTVVEVV